MQVVSCYVLVVVRLGAVAHRRDLSCDLGPLFWAPLTF